MDFTLPLKGFILALTLLLNIQNLKFTLYPVNLDN